MRYAANFAFMFLAAMLAFGTCVLLEKKLDVKKAPPTQEPAAVVTEASPHEAIRFVDLPFPAPVRLWVNIHLQFEDGPLCGTPTVMRCELDRRVTAAQIERLALPRIDVEGGHYEQPRFTGVRDNVNVTVRYLYVAAPTDPAKPKPPQGQAQPWFKRRLLGDDDIGTIGSGP